MNKKRALHILYGLFVFMTAAAAVICFVLVHELKKERDILDGSYVLLLDHNVTQADVLLSTLDTSLITRVRRWLGQEDPYTYFLRGSIKMEQGRYLEAIRYLQQSLETCRNVHREDARCHTLAAEVLFRQGNASLLSFKRRAFNDAMLFFHKGLLLNPNDVYAKKSLVWLKMFQERVNKEQESQEKSFSRGLGVLEKKGEVSSSGKERKGY